MLLPQIKNQSLTVLSYLFYNLLKLDSRVKVINL